MSNAAVMTVVKAATCFAIYFGCFQFGAVVIMHGIGGGFWDMCPAAALFCAALTGYIVWLKHRMGDW